jgi:hypothetical protein
MSHCLAPAPAFALADAPRRFFAHRAEYLAWRAAWRALLVSDIAMTPALYAAHTLLAGRDLYRAFSPNGHTPEPYGALVRALRMLAGFPAWRVWHRQLAARVGDEHARVLVAALSQAAVALEALALDTPAARADVAHGRGQFRPVATPGASHPRPVAP